MAVQAQYPSNLLFFNRNGQEGSNNMLGIGINNYMLLQQQPVQVAVAGTPAATTTTGTFHLDQSPHLLSDNHNHGVGGGVPNHNNNNSSTITNQRKRGREALTTTTTTTSTTPFTFSLQDHHNHQQQQQQQQQQNLHPQLIQLSQLHHHNNHPNAAVVSTGLKLSFGDQQIQQQQNSNRQQHNHNNNYNNTPSVGGGGTSSCSHNNNNNSTSNNHNHNHNHNNPNPASLSSDEFLANQFKKQSDEINHFILTQGEHLRRTVAEKRQRHYRTLLSAAEESITRRLREKEAELEKATRRHAELEARAAHITAESHLWQAKARAQDAQAASLQTQLQQAMMGIVSVGFGSASKPVEVEDGDNNTTVEDCESAYIDPDRVVEMSPSPLVVGLGGGCKGCGMKAATVVILPCRHFCLCLECDGVVQTCPVCFGMRNSSVEVYLT